MFFIILKRKQALQRIEQKTKVQKRTVTSFAEIDSMGRKTLMGKVELSQPETKELKRLAQKGIASDAAISDLKRELQSARRDARIWKRRYAELREQTKDFMEVLKCAPIQMKELLSMMMKHGRDEPQQSPDISIHTVER